MRHSVETGRRPRTAAGRATALCAAVLLLAACGDDVRSPTMPSDDAIAAATPARAFGIWTPGEGECPKAVHDRYATIGPDGKRYPTWHPPVDPATGCSFGHEHGRDPRGSVLYAEVGDLPFGYANERLEESDLGLHRHEDHVGHKIEWENGVRMNVGGPGGSVLSVQCDVLTKLHQGTHSKDAFTNNLHELNYHIRCTDRTEMHVTMLTAIGKAGEFERSCGGTVQVGPATPANSPDGGGKRRIPDRSCLESALLVAPGARSNFGALKETWQLHAEVRAAEKNRRLATFNPYFQVFRPSRFYDPSAPDGVGRPVALCAEVLPGDRRARGGDCEAFLTAVGAAPDAASLSLGALRFDDTRSPFNGVRRQVDVNNNTLRNGGGPTVWYTDALGRNGRTTPFPGSIRQVLAAIDNDYGVSVNGPAVGGDRDYGGPGTRAPN